MRHGEFTQPCCTNEPLQTNREAAKEFPIFLRDGGLKRTVVVFILEVVPFERNFSVAAQSHSFARTSQ
ncbi:MAG: hypothetical protein DWH97_03960 [Planctomycetota bacterium]|jgi:hypothetical protein|nr:MAG: hypothetical protein DWH97_03960 [Planctomycetota bacterium]